MLRSRDAWHVRSWDEGSVAWNAVTGNTHAMDPLTAEVLIASRQHAVDDMRIAEHLAHRLDLELDETLRHAILGALERIHQLEAT